MEPKTVFISYSHKDEKYLHELKSALAPTLGNHPIDLWDDTRIDAGDRWNAEIEKALAQASVAILLVSRHFLESRFITTNELPEILKAADHGTMKILWVYLSPCDYQETPIQHYQAAHRPLIPLRGLPPVKRDAIWKEICNEIKKATLPPNPR